MEVLAGDSLTMPERCSIRRGMMHDPPLPFLSDSRNGALFSLLTCGWSGGEDLGQREMPFFAGKPYFFAYCTAVNTTICAHY